MSDFTQALLISGGIFALVVARGYGRRVFDRRALMLPVAAVGVFGVIYLKDAPIGSPRDWLVYATAVVVGLVFGVVATAVTRIERDDRSGRLLTITGPAFVAVWATAVVARLTFVWAVTNNPTLRNHFGEFMIGHHLDFATIAPFFLLWALTMVVSRIVLLKIRERGLPQRDQFSASNTVCAERPMKPVAS
ncbi:hypothetical protein AAFP30_13185 [Gordonia sp. CPCC 205515]|uniref:hypothetical protein n=1 Tax=Gordonia sp. CPCC 205515 TaxID=3140791 RepID=UPI003AF3A9AA